jgi:hypothetical protein
MDYPVSFNVMEDVGYDKRHLVVSGLMSTFKKIWVDAWSARMEYILGNTLLALLEYPDSTLLDVNKMLSDKNFRNKVVENITDMSVKSFWVDEFAKYTDRFASEATPAIQNKIGQFTSNPLIRNIIGQPKSSFDVREMMDKRKIIIINLSKGRIGETNANLLGSMLITKIYLAALSRADLSNNDLESLPNFYLYVDEFQSFANESFADILSEARKYKLNLTIAHQYIEQMSEPVRAAVFGNVGTLVTFRVGAYDAEVLEREFAPTFAAQDIVNLGKFQLYLRLMIDGISSHPFSATSMPPLQKDSMNFMQDIISASRGNFAKPRVQVEEIIKNLNKIEEAPKPPKQNNFEKKFEKKKDDRQKEEKPKNFIQNQEKQNQGQNNSERPKNSLMKQKMEEALKRGPEKPDDFDQESVSLKDMTLMTKNNSSKNFPQKKSENNNALKAALSEVLGKDVVKNSVNLKDKEDNRHSNTTGPEKNPKNEVPESELRKILGL